jgi:hypothetical protein
LDSVSDIGTLRDGIGDPARPYACGHARSAPRLLRYAGRVSVDHLAALVALPGVSDACDRARADVDRLLGHKVMRKRSAEVSAEAGLRCARASALLEGEECLLDELRAGGGGPAARGALRMSAELGPLVSVWQRAPLQALARLHVLAAADVAPPDQLGRPHGDDFVAARLAQLVDILGRPTTAPAVVVAAIVHGELLTVAPFTWGSGLVARAAARLVLIARGLDPKGVTAPDVGHAQDVETYHDAASVYASGDPSSWLRLCAAAVSFGAVEGLAIAEALTR